MTERIQESLLSLAVSIDDPLLDSRNARAHGSENIGQIKLSLEKYGQCKPVVVNATSGIIEAGNGMVVAARELGWKRIAVARVNHNKADAMGYALMDNKSALSSDWELPNLKDILQELDTGAFDMDATGFSQKEIEELMCQFHTGLTDDDAIPERVETICKTGDLWQLGEHRLLCGDSTKKEDVERLMNGEKVDMVFTDPPYGVNYDGGTKVTKKLQGDSTTELYNPCCRMAFDYSIPEAPLYLWHAGVKGIAAAAAAAAAGYEIRCEIIWNKNQAQFGALSAQYKQKHEPCYYCFKRGKRVNWCGTTNEVTVWDVDRQSSNEYHPTQKPVALGERAMLNHTGKVILDLFGGSGSTLIACEKLGRKCRMMEIDEYYCGVILARWEAYTGKKAVKL